MACKITFTFLSESLAGNIGDDWKYSLHAQVYGSGAGSHALISEGVLEVPKHALAPGTTQAPPGPPKPLVLPAGDAGGEIRIELRFKAVEVDVLLNDTGETNASFKLTCPEAGGAPVVEERDISLGVEEEPSGIGTAVLGLRYRVTVESE